MMSKRIVYNFIILTKLLIDLISYTCKIHVLRSKKVKKILNFVLKLIFNVSHGNASVKCVLSVNKQFDFGKQYKSRNYYYTFHQGPCVCKWMITSYTEINNGLNTVIKKARGRYQKELEEKKSCKEKDEKGKQSALHLFCITIKNLNNCPKNL